MNVNCSRIQNSQEPEISPELLPVFGGLRVMLMFGSVQEDCDVAFTSVKAGYRQIKTLCMEKH